MIKLTITVALSVLISGCGSMQQAINSYSGVAISSAQQANDAYAQAWSSAACGTTVGAAMRNPKIIPALKLLCMPHADVDPKTLLEPSATK